MSNNTKKASKSEKVQTVGISHFIRGWPGYRTRGGRSGLDPIDNDAEGGFMAGILLRRLVTGTLRTKKPLDLLLLAVVGICFCAPVFMAILEALRGNLLPIGAWVVTTMAGTLGIAMLVNLIKNIMRIFEAQ
jgi:hypothetical protein